MKAFLVAYDFKELHKMSELKTDIYIYIYIYIYVCVCVKGCPK
jgi:hypothetical protein